MHYRDIFEKQFHRFSKTQKVYFEQACNNCATEITKTVAAGSLGLTVIYRAESIRDDLLKIVEAIRQRR